MARNKNLDSITNGAKSTARISEIELGVANLVAERMRDDDTAIDATISELTGRDVLASPKCFEFSASLLVVDDGTLEEAGSSRRFRREFDRDGEFARILAVLISVAFCEANNDGVRTREESGLELGLKLATQGLLVLVVEEILGAGRF